MVSSLIDDLARAVTEEEEYLTVAQFAETFQLHPRTVYYRIDHREIGHFKLGRGIRIPRSEVIRLAQKNYRAAVDE